MPTTDTRRLATSRPHHRAGAARPSGGGDDHARPRRAAARHHLVEVVGGQQGDDDWQDVTDTRIRRNRPAGSFTLDQDLFVAARRGAGALTVRRGDTMIAIDTA
jgi:hypothetical protein